MSRKRANLTDLLNDLTFRVIFNKYKLIAINEYEYEGLPDGMLERHIERELFDRGFLAFVDDPYLSYMALPAHPHGNAKGYGDPVSYFVEGFDYRREYNADDVVIIENNKLRLSTKEFLLFYVNKLVEAERTMDVNVKANKTPIMILCDKNNELSLKAIFNRIDGNAPAIFADRSLKMEDFEALDLKARFLGNDLMDYKKSVENELLTFLGINNIPGEKKERLITDEANSNNQLIESFFEIGLEARQRAVEEINRKFGLNISVRRRGGNVENSVENSEEGVVENV